MLNKEPTAIINGISELLRQIIPMLIIFGLIHWTDLQTAAAFAVMSAFLSLVSILVTRSQVVPNEKADAQIKTALSLPASASVAEVIAKTEARQT